VALDSGSERTGVRVIDLFGIIGRYAPSTKAEAPGSDPMDTGVGCVLVNSGSTDPREGEGEASKSHY